MLALKPSVGEFPKLPTKNFPKVQERETAEAKYWRSYSACAEHKLQSAANCIHFNPLYNYADPTSCSYIITASIRIDLFDSHDKLQRSYSRFNDDAFSGHFRRDAKLICAGDKTGTIRVFDTASKAILRQMKHHSAAVRRTIWSIDGSNVLSASDDRQVLRWDLATEAVLWNSGSGGHSDYVRALDAHPQSGDVFASGSYDHTVKLWDSRQAARRPVMVLAAPVPSTSEGLDASTASTGPVESVLFAQSGAVLLAAQGSSVKAWDLLAGGRLLHSFNNHQKNVSGLCLDAPSGRLLSCGLDGFVKIYSLRELKVVHSLRFPSPLVAVACPPDGAGTSTTDEPQRVVQRKIAVAAVDGTVTVRSRERRGAGKKDLASGGKGEMESEQEEGDGEEGVEEDSGLSLRPQTTIQRQLRHHKGSIPPADIDATLAYHAHPQQRLQPYEKLLKKFSYGKALDAALRSRHPAAVTALLRELLRRGGIRAALAGRDEGQLEPLLSFAARHVVDPKYSPTIVQVIHHVLDLYAGVLGRSEIIDELFCRLQRQIKGEVTFQRQVMRIMGSLDGIISVATMPGIVGPGENSAISII